MADIHPAQCRPDAALLQALVQAVTGRLERHAGLLVLGIGGAQGSGKSTLARALGDTFTGEGLACAVLSLDDLYLTRAARERLARDVHPLLRTRGVPGTHDVALGLATIAALERGEAAPLPRFDKGRDDRLPEAQWPRAPRRTRLLVLEGWCLGAAPQDAAALAEPVGALEAAEDPQGLWRGYANAALGGAYRQLFARIDFLAFLAAPDFAVVARWRGEAEEALRRAGAPQAMDAAAIPRFVAHYERITRQLLRHPPGQADLIAHLGDDRQVLRIRRN